MGYYEEELFAQKTPYLQWLKEQEKYSGAHTGKKLCRLPFCSCEDKVIDIAEAAIHRGVGGIEDKAVYLFERKDGELSKDAEYEIWEAFRQNKKVQLVYADEDYLGGLDELYGLEDDGALYRGEPWFKPDYSPDTLSAFFYIGSIFAVRGAILREAVEKGLNLYELVCLSADMDREKVVHIPKVLYTNNSLSGVSELEGRGLMADEGYVPDELVSVIIPSRDNSKVLGKCLDTLTEITSYKNYELIIVDNGSKNEEKAAVYGLTGRLKQKNNGLNIEYIWREMPFNFSVMCNIGARMANGKYLLFLNDDTEIIEPEWLKNMLSSAALSHVGAVGAKLYYPREENSDSYLIQHIGIANMGIGPAHKLSGLEDSGSLYHGHNLVTYDMLAVTGACMMIQKAKFDAAGGFDEELAVAYNDVELCFRLYKAGYYNLVRNDARLVHCESLSRGSDDSAEKRERLSEEKQMLYNKYPDMEGTDPFYSPNLVQWKRDVKYNTGYLYFCDNEALPVRLADDIIRTLPRAHKNKLIRRMTGENRIMLTIDEIKTGDIETPHYCTERLASIVGWYLIRGKDNACVEKALLLKKTDNNSHIYILPVYPQLRGDVSEMIENSEDSDRTKNTELCGIRVIFNCMALVEGSYEIGIVATAGNERRGYIKWSGCTIDI